MANGAHLKNIIRIKVGNKEYDITILEVVFDLPSMQERYYCMYAYLEDSADIEDGIGDVTFREGNVIGVDTAHYYNKSQSLEEKYDDGIRQITNSILEYQKIMETRNTDLKYQVKKRAGK